MTTARERALRGARQKALKFLPPTEAELRRRVAKAMRLMLFLDQKRLVCQLCGKFRAYTEMMDDVSCWRCVRVLRDEYLPKIKLLESCDGGVDPDWL